MTDVSETRGWKNRRKLAEINNYSNADAERLAIRAERARMYAEADAENERAAEAAAAAIEAARCTCSACGGAGSQTIVEAARIIDAMQRYNFAGYSPSQAVLAALTAMARGETPPPASPQITFTRGTVRPGAVGSIAKEPTTVTPKPSTRPTKPTKGAEAVEDDDAFTSDGALIEI